jgi:TP901 family phage tail tape measure protein
MVGRFLSTAITAPVTALGTAAMKTSIDFDSSFATVRKTVNGTEEDLAKLAAASKEMSTQIATSTTDINHVMSTGGQLGIATEHIEDFTRVMIDLEKASTDLDADTAATQLA